MIKHENDRTLSRDILYPDDFNASEIDAKREPQNGDNYSADHAGVDWP
jgi:hypothetical protein